MLLYWCEVLCILIKACGLADPSSWLEESKRGMLLSPTVAIGGWVDRKGVGELLNGSCILKGLLCDDIPLSRACWEGPRIGVTCGRFCKLVCALADGNAIVFSRIGPAATATVPTLPSVCTYSTGRILGCTNSLTPILLMIESSLDSFSLVTFLVPD